MQQQGKKPSFDPNTSTMSSKAATESDSNHPRAYGSFLSHIRETDKVAVEKINRPDPKDLMRSKRILNELQKIHKSTCTPYMSITPIEDNLDNCLASLEGPPGTPYAGGIFWLHIAYPIDYPVSPPLIRFITPIFHPNIDQEGLICLDIFTKEGWAVGVHMEMALLCILARLCDPEIDDALCPDVARCFVEDYETFEAVVRVWTEEFAHRVRPGVDELESIVKGIRIF